MKINMNQLLMISILLLLIKCETWWGEVSGHDTSDGKNGYAGSRGKAITAFYLCGDRKYRVHYKGDSKDTWTGEYCSCDPVGIGRSIDGISISGGYSYKVRYKNGNWEKPVTGYSINDSKNGYAGTLGKEIDAILIEGDNIYRAAYGGHSSNVEEVSKRVNESIEEILLKHKNKRIAVFAHGYAITFYLLKYCTLVNVDETRKLTLKYKDKIVMDKVINAPEVFRLVFDDKNNLKSIKLIEFKDLPFMHGGI